MPMTPERHTRTVELFEEALALPPEARLEFLARSCAGNDDLRREVEAMLASAAQSDRFLE